MNSFNKLHTIGKKAAHLKGVIHLLDWDQETYLPPEGAEPRSEQVALVSSIRHDLITSETYRQTLESFEPDTEDEKACHREWMRDFKHAIALPSSFVEEFAKTTSEAVEVWKEARQKSDFSLFAPALKKVMNLSRQKAEYLGYKETPYDALLDDYEPDTTTSQIEVLFDDLKKEIIPLLKTIKNKTEKKVAGTFGQEEQLAFSRKIAEKMGFSFKSGRLDLTTHPFCTSLHPLDNRITTRVYTEEPISCLMGVIHETGHALYDAGLPIKWFGTPLGEYISMGMQESQSRFWETRIGQSRPFWTGFYKELQTYFPTQLKAISEEEFYHIVNRVEPTFVRVESDEVTYPLHVILRFEIEKALINDLLPVEEIPALWNQKMKDYLGITPPNDKLGCLQDVHWSCGHVGYFPTYTLGNMYAAILFNAFKKDHADWEKRVSNGELSFINDWQKQAVHQYGRRYRSLPLLEKISKAPFSAKPYTDYLKEKYQNHPRS